MPLFTEFSVLPLDIFVGSIAIDPENFIIVDIADYQHNQTGPYEQAKGESKHVTSWLGNFWTSDTSIKSGRECNVADEHDAKT
jgi:hypothetical protein